MTSRARFLTILLSSLSPLLMGTKPLCISCPADGLYQGREGLCESVGMKEVFLSGCRPNAVRELQTQNGQRPNGMPDGGSK